MQHGLHLACMLGQTLRYIAPWASCMHPKQDFVDKPEGSKWSGGFTPRGC